MFTRIKSFFFKPKPHPPEPVLRFCGARRSDYLLNLTSSLGSVTAPDCTVWYDDKQVAYFQNMCVEGPRLIINHFAVDGEEIGNKIADRVVYGFAQIVDQYKPSITEIQFDLGKPAGLPEEDRQTLANARLAFLRRIGATDLTDSRDSERPNRHTIVIGGVWHKRHWGLS